MNCGRRVSTKPVSTKEDRLEANEDAGGLMLERFESGLSTDDCCTGMWLAEDADAEAVGGGIPLVGGRSVAGEAK